MSLFFINLDTQPLERFDMGQFQEFNVDNYDPLTSAFFEQLLSVQLRGNFIVQGQEERPDLVSNEIYSNVQLWWILMFINSILEVEDIVQETVFSFTDISDIDDIFFNLKSEEVSSA